MVGTDRVVFRGPAPLTAGWVGPWPPPERLAVLTGAVTGEQVVVDLASLPPALNGFFDELVANGSTVTHFRLASASGIAEPAPPDAHWFRGVEYLPEAAEDLSAKERP